MNPKYIILIAITLLLGSLLGWQYFNGGIPSHHILQQKDLPAISNGWGIIVLPLLSWMLLNRVEKRRAPVYQKKWFRAALPLLSAGLLIGVGIAVAFTNDYQPVLENVPYLFLLISCIIPIFYSEFILGFVIGMSYTFGVLLPTVFILVVALIGLVMYQFIRPFFVKLVLRKR